MSMTEKVQPNRQSKIENYNQRNKSVPSKLSETQKGHDK